MKVDSRFHMLHGGPGIVKSKQTYLLTANTLQNTSSLIC